ncbi:MAG TPA: VOC family protein, partial [Rhizomicrobium sp.]
MADETKSLAGRNLVQVGLTCRDLERAKHFYRDVLGLPLLFEVGGMLFFQLGTQRLMIGREQSPG